MRTPLTCPSSSSQAELQGLRGSVMSLETLRNEVYQLQRELLQATLLPPPHDCTAHVA